MITGIILVVIGIVLLILFLYNDLDKRVKNLYTEDYHNTNRPKVDILADENEKSHDVIWDKIREMDRERKELFKEANKPIYNTHNEVKK